MSYSPPPFVLCQQWLFLPPLCSPENHAIPPSFFLYPPPPMINNDRCFGFNFPWAERSNFTSSAQRTCLQHLVSGKLSLFFHFFWLFLFLFLFLVLFLFLCFFLLCSLDAILSQFVYVFIESPVKKMKKPSKPWQKLISLRKVLNRRKL